MPIDASIYDRMIQPLKQPESPLDIMQGVANLRDSQALAQQRQELVQEKIRQAQEDGQIRQIMADPTADMPTKIQRMYAINPKTAGDVQKTYDVSQKAKLDLTDTVNEHASRALALYDPKDPTSWGHTQAAASAVYQMFGMPVPQQFQGPPPDQATVDKWKQTSLSVKEQVDNAKKKYESKEVLGPDNKTVTLQNYDTSTGTIAPVTDAQGQPVLSPKTAELANTAATQARLEQHQTTQEGMERQRLGIEGAHLRLDQTKAAQENAANQAAVAAANPNAPHGVDFLKSLPDPIAAQVKALDEGRMQFPSSFALKTPYWQQMLSNVAQYDPNFDAVNYNARAKTRAAFTSGKEGQQINAMNTAIGHLGQLADKVTEMGNSSLTPVNMLANPLSKLGGSSKVTNFDTVREAVIDEATRVYRQAGGSEGDIKARREQMADTNSPSQLYDAIRETANLIKSKIDSSQSQYEQGMGMAKADIPILQPHAQQALQKLDALAGKQSSASPLGPAEGDTGPQQRPIPGVPGGIAELRNGRWIRVQ